MCAYSFVSFLVLLSLLVDCPPGDVATTAKQDQGEDHLAEEQQDDSADTEKSDLLNHSLTINCHGIPLNSRHCDIEAVDVIIGGLLCNIKKRLRRQNILGREEFLTHLLG